ncbi:MAG TPA: hypothetical protein DCM64_07135 [Gammaproteobacteria bacterium]|nr:hypothetical protein [Gammaproteobacteria bacterium]
MDLEFTDLPISYGACWGPTPESGRIIIHSETIQSNPKYWAAPSYYVRGRYIFADLIAGVCDIRDSLVGELGEFQINGEFLRGGWGNDYHIGNFHAEPVESAEGI